MTTLAEGERVGLSPWIEKCDLEGAADDGAGLADELIQPLLGEGAVALGVNVGSVGLARLLPVDEYTESRGTSCCRRSHDEMKVAGVEAAGDPSVGRVERGGLFLHRPVPEQGPLVEPQLRGGGIDMRFTWHGAAGGCEVLGALIAGVVFR